MTTAATTDLAACLALVSEATPGELTVCDDNDGDGWPPRPLWAFKNPAYDCEDEDTPALHGHITCGGKEDAYAIAASVNLLRTHGATLQRALALLAAVESGEWKCVPVEATEAMEIALSDALGSGDFSIGACLDKAIEAAPSAPGVECWCQTCRPITLSDMRFVVCPECGNKRCPKANHHVHACTGSNEPGQVGSAYQWEPQPTTHQEPEADE